MAQSHPQMQATFLDGLKLNKYKAKMDDSAVLLSSL